MDAKQITGLLDIYVPLERAGEVHGLIKMLITYSAADSHMDAGFVVGQSHTGKSGTVLDYIKDGRDEWIAAEGGRKLDYAYVRIRQGGVSVKSMMIQVLEVLGDDAPEEGNERQLTARAKRYLKEAGVKLLILDEFQQLIEKKQTQKAIYQVADTLKNFLDEGICPILIVGIDTVIPLLAANEQFANRATRKVTLLPLEISTAAQFQDYQDFLWSFLQQTPIKFPDATSELVVRRLYEATEGYVGRLGKFLKRSAEVADQAGAEEVTFQHMSEAWASHTFFSEGRKNPFRMSLAELTEIQRGPRVREKTLVEGGEGW